MSTSTSRGDWIDDLKTSVNADILTANGSVMSCQGVANASFTFKEPPVHGTTMY